ncbi:MAG: Dot/Icm secretion system ATPase DotB [Gammaproteobacteria bacterium RIFCSPHIGHO2_12_FULL_40_19]|nr:MAG: Dot/Icm secretion system ATPase DotB [Gammaproteobacteria bacterium RIFCSPHIGHO2_12_FULL_40_19]
MPDEMEPIVYPNEPTRFDGSNVDDLLVFCHRANASDITIQTAEPIIIEVYGRIHKITKRKLANTEVGDLLNAIYGPNGTTQLMRGNDLDTHYEVRPSRNERFRYRVNGVGCYTEGHEGVQITIRTIPSTPPSLNTLNLPQQILDNMAPQQGVVYVTGATGSGKSTLLASMIKSLSEEPTGNRKILTYEAPIEFVYDSVEMPTSVVAQSEIPRHLPSFADGVRNALRRKPHLILVGEARDPETISAVLEAALTGHPVYTTLHTNGVAETIRRLVGSFPQEERLGRTIDIIESLRLIVWQRLVPSVDGKRIPLREFLVFSEALRDRLLDSDPENITQTTRLLLSEHGQSMLSDVEAKYKEGLLSDRWYQILTARLKHT